MSNTKISAGDHEFTCCICGKVVVEWGNNPYPVKEEGECCDRCNNERVIPERLKDWRY